MKNINKKMFTKLIIILKISVGKRGKLNAKLCITKKIDEITITYI
jgi:hypothetical protein